MKRLLTDLLRDRRGTNTLEFAIVVPILVLFIYGIFVTGQLFQANAGMQHALGEGARLATLCVNPQPTTGCSAPLSNGEIKSRIDEKVFGTAVGEFESSVTNPTADYKELSVTFTTTPDFLFFEGPEIDITRTKRVYVAT